MTDAGVVIIFLWFGMVALLGAAIPGLLLGLLVGLFVKRRDLGCLACLAISAISTFITYWGFSHPHHTLVAEPQCELRRNSAKERSLVDKCDEPLGLDTCLTRDTRACLKGATS